MVDINRRQIIVGGLAGISGFRAPLVVSAASNSRNSSLEAVVKSVALFDSAITVQVNLDRLEAQYRREFEDFKKRKIQKEFTSVDTQTPEFQKTIGTEFSLAHRRGMLNPELHDKENVLRFLAAYYRSFDLDVYSPKKLSGNGSSVILAGNVPNYYLLLTTRHSYIRDYLQLKLGDLKSIANGKVPVNTVKTEANVIVGKDTIQLALPIKESPWLDYVLFDIPRSDGIEAYPNRFATNQLDIGQDVYLVGAPLGQKVKIVRKGIISILDPNEVAKLDPPSKDIESRHLFAVNVGVAQGDSGGIVLDDRLNLLGTVHGIHTIIRDICIAIRIAPIAANISDYISPSYTRRI